jgi:hypothetical protein
MILYALQEFVKPASSQLENSLHNNHHKTTYFLVETIGLTSVTEAEVF